LIIDAGGELAAELPFVDFSVDCAVMSEGIEAAMISAAARGRKPVIFL